MQSDISVHDAKKPAAKRLTKDKLRKFLIGTRTKNGAAKTIAVYALLICIGFIYLYPVLYMVSASFMSLDDLLDSSIKWIPSRLNVSNYVQAGQSMDFWKSFGQSVLIAGLPTLCTLLSCSVIGYGLARFRFPGSGVIMGIIVFSFVLPGQVLMIPTYVMYSEMKILGTVWSFILPALLGQGLNAPIFILIFRQFFRTVPKALIEAASIDGAGYFRSFWRISLPAAIPAFITVSLFSFVWYWNESYLTELYVHGVLTDSGWTTLVLQLRAFASNYNTYQVTAQSGATSLNEALKMAGTLLAVLPLLIMYFVLQKYFTESIDRTGITGE
ncbi:MAG: carbohydrate ABC transporter permease [Clostridia bacterium]|nr:carbohydrate ABC transporter permease [Clostridia bacterium]